MHVVSSRFAGRKGICALVAVFFSLSIFLPFLSPALAGTATVAMPVVEQLAQPAPLSFSPEQLARLSKGEVFSQATIETLNRGEVVGVIEAPLEQVFSVITDYDSYPRWYPDQRHATMIAREGLSIWAQGELRMPFPFPNRRYEVRTERRELMVDGERHLSIRWRYLPGSGNFREMYGFWYLMPFAGDEKRTLCRYVLYADLGTWLPDVVIRWAQRRKLPGIINGLREYKATMGK